jgi:hypothetical protein
MIKSYTLSDGTVIPVSTLKSNKTGYTGAALWPTFNNNLTTPFVAAVSNPRDPKIMRKLRCQKRTSWHGGAYRDSREAAYVAARFRQDPVGTDRIIGQSRAFTSFPSDLYQLPQTLTPAQAVTVIKRKSQKKAATVSTISLKLPKGIKVTAARVLKDGHSLEIAIDICSK